MPPPIIFTVPGSKEDVRLTVFDQEFHVHSGLLKIRSAFFRKFLDPPNRPNQGPASLKFQYEWYTKVEDDGMWVLSDNSELRGALVPPIDGVEVQVQCFHKLLCAIFNRNYKISKVAELTILVQLADYFCAVPAVSYSINQVLLNSPALLAAIQREPCTILELGFKLRNKTLFSEAFIYALGPWSNPRYKNLTNPTILALCQKAYDEVSAKVSGVFKAVFEASTGNDIEGHQAGQRCWDFMHYCVENRGGGPIEYPNIFYLCSERVIGYYRPLLLLISALLENYLFFNQDAVAGGELHSDYFFCFRLKDEDLPWDVTQIDW